jgi:histidine ammonia-lyase
MPPAGWRHPVYDDNPTGFASLLKLLSSRLIESDVYNIKKPTPPPADPRPAVTIGPSKLRIDQVLAIATGSARIALDDSPAFRQKLKRSVELLDHLIESGEVIYGVTTGFGASCEAPVPIALTSAMAVNLVRFHGCGTGRILDETEAAAVMVVRLASLAQGRSGVRTLLLERMCDLINRRILPQIPAEGSVGASGDLTPLSYVAALLIGEREVSCGGRVTPAADALAAARLKPIELRPKESLALMNGTSVMTGLACIAYERALRISRWAASLTAMASDVLRSNRGHFDQRLFLAKPHPGQLACARWIAADIEYIANASKHDGRIQDRYSIRCAPHVIGVLLDCLAFIRDLIETEINSSNDNPLLDPATGDILHGGNFYGGHPCMAMDMLKIAVANIADLIDRQMALLCNPHTNNGLPADLVARRGGDQVSHHGFKAMQITTSALTAEALKLTMPASVFSRSTESQNQDKVSMGTIAARDALRVAELTETVLAITQLALCQAVDLRGGEGSHCRSRELHQAIRQSVPVNDADRRQDLDIQRVLDLYRAGELPIGSIDFPGE